MRTRQEIPAFFYREGSYEGILKLGIEVKVSSGECLADKCSSYMRRGYIFLIMILPEQSGQFE